MLEAIRRIVNVVGRCNNNWMRRDVLNHEHLSATFHWWHSTIARGNQHKGEFRKNTQMLSNGKTPEGRLRTYLFIVKRPLRVRMRRCVPLQVPACAL